MEPIISHVYDVDLNAAYNRLSRIEFTNDESKEGYEVIGYVNPSHDIMKVIKEYQQND